MVSDKVNDGRSWCVMTNTGVWKRRLVAPPALPFVVAPRAAQWAELVATHDLGADVVGEVPREVIVEAATPAGVGAVGPARRGARPRKHVAGVGVTERALEALISTRAESIPRDTEILGVLRIELMRSS